MADGKIIIETGLDNSGIESGLNQLKGIAAIGIGKAIEKTVQAGISFESAFTGVTKTVDATDEELAALRINIRGMAKEMPESVEEISGVAEAAGQLGIKTKNITGFTKTMVQLGDATNLSSEEAATSLARFANMTGMSQKKFDRLGSTVVALGNNMATTESEIVEMGMRISGAGSQVGLTEAQIMSFSAALSSVGIEAEAGGTAFSTLLSKMNLATEKGGDELTAFADVAGMSAEQFKASFKEDAAGAVLSFIQGLDGINKNGGSAIKTLDEMGLSDVRIRDALLRAAGASDTFTEALDIGTKAWDENTALTKEAETRYQTMESQLAMTKNKLNDIGISVYDSLEEPMVKGVAAANKALDKLSDKIEAGGIEEVIPEEAVVTVQNLGKAAKVAAKGGIKALGTGLELIGDNMGTVIPLASAFLGASKGYQMFSTIAPKIMTANKAINAFGAAQILCTANGIKCNATLTAGQAVLGLLTGKVTTATAATTVFNGVLTALGGPVGIAALSIGALATGIIAYRATLPETVTESEKFLESCKDLKEEQNELSESIQQVREDTEDNIRETQTQGVQVDNLFKKLKNLVKVEDKTAGTKAQIKSVVEELNGILPDLGLVYDDEADKLNKSTKAIRDNINALKEQAMAKAYQSGMEDWAEKVAEADIAHSEALEKQTEAYQKMTDAKNKYKALVKKAEVGEISWNDKQFDKLEKEASEYATAYSEASETVAESSKNLLDAQQGLNEYEGLYSAQTNYVEYLNNLDTLAKEAGIKAKKIPESVSLGIQQGIYSVPNTGDELKNLIKLDSLVQEAKTAGVQVPASVAQGIQSGKYALPTSVAQMKALIKLDDLQSQTFVSGVKVPKNMAKGIASGKTKPAAAVRQMNNLVEFDDLVKNSGISGTSAVQSLVASVNAGRTKPKEAIEQMLSLTGDATDKSAKKSGEKSGKQVVDSTSESIDKNKGKVKESSQEAVTDASDVDYSGIVTLGGNMMLGLAASIDENSPVVSAATRRAVRNSIDAANDEADSHSPSRAFEKEVGKFLPLGLAKGIIDNTDAVETAARGMAKASIKATADELEINSPSKAYKKAIGENIPSGVAKGVREAQNVLNAEMKSMASEALDAAKTASKDGSYSEIGNNLVNQLSTALNTAQQDSSETIQDIISRQQDKVSNKNSKREEKLQKKIGDTKKKKKKKRLKKELRELQKQNKKEEKQMEEAGAALANAYNTAFEKEAERLTAIAQKQIQELSEEYQEQYNEIKTQMDSLISKQQSWGNIYDLDQNIYDLKRYQENIKALEKNIPESMMERILGMNVDEASAYMDWFRAMSAKEQKAYIEKWNVQQDMAESFSEAFFSDDFARIEVEYSAKLKSATDNLQSQMQEAGRNIAAGLTAGMEKETRNMTKAMKKICNQLIKTAKKTLKIKSPSKKYEQIGKYNIQGAEKGHEKEAPKMYRQMETISETMAQRFARAKLNLPELQSRMQAAVSRQMERISGAQVRVAFAGAGNGTVKEQTIYTGPEKIEVPVVLEGREIARVTAPYMDKKLDAITNRKTRGGV